VPTIDENHWCIRQAVEKGLIDPRQLGPRATMPKPADAPRKVKSRVANVATSTRCHWMISLTLPCRVVSEANRSSGEHWTAKYKRKKSQREALAIALVESGLAQHKPPLPLVVTFLRHGRQKMDDDNLQRAFKGLRDAVARWIGLDDADKRIEWRYKQQAGKPGVEVKIEGGNP
jgi:hypothetical protein